MSAARCLIVTRLAAEFAEEIARLGGADIPVTACANAEEARAAYRGEEVLFGNPRDIALLLPDTPDVKWVQSSWAGVTPLVEADRRGYVLTGIKDVFGPQMAEYVLGHLLAHELRVVERRRRQLQREWYPAHSGVLDGKTIGIMGTGSIGSHIAAAAAAFNLQRIGLSRSGKPVPAFDSVWPGAGLADFLARSDYLVSTLPATAETDGLLDGAALARLPAGAVFINVGRSNVVDDVALVESLGNGQLAAAVLDVFDEEPLPARSPLWNAPNLTVTAHVAAVSHPLLIVPVFVDNYRRFAAHEPLRYVVDFDAGY